MESSKDKKCPFMMTVSSPFVSGECIEEQCAWWCGFAQDCAAPLIAGILADSSINQVDWKGSADNDRL